MGKILDLSAFSEETLDIRTLEGTIIHLKKPTQGIAIAMLQLRHLDDNTAPEAALALQNSIVHKILNHNADGLTFSLENVAALTLPVKNGLITNYAQFAQELQANPTTSSLPSPAKKPMKKRSFFGAFMRRRNTRE